jgi:hypothetical protein
MRDLWLFVLLVAAGGAGGFAGSILGGAFGQTALFVGGFAGGLIAAPAGALVAARLGWLARADARATAIGAALGFVAAATVAVLTIDGPIGPLLSPLLVGAGGIAGRAARRARTAPVDRKPAAKDP